MNDQFLTIRQTAKALGVPETFIRREVKRGGIPGFRCGNRAYIDVTKFAANLERAVLKEGDANG